MPRRILFGSFANEKDILSAVQTVRENGFQIADVYSPYAVHGMDQAMGLRPSRLPWACFAFGLMGATIAFGFQFWSMAWSWPVNVGGKPWNSLPAYVPVAFELTVLLAGLGVVLAFFIRSGLFLGKEATPLFSDVTNNRFVIVLEETGAGFDAGAARRLLLDCNAIRVEEREE
jgi:hypothetical protein